MASFDLRSSELEHIFIKERISNVEKHFSDLSLKFAAYIKKLAYVRDSGDDLAKCVLQFASKESLNHTVRTCLGEFSDVLSTIQEYRDTKIKRTEVKVGREFEIYGTTCKKAKGELKKCFDARAKEVSKKNQLEKARSKYPTNWQKITQAETEVNQAQGEATRCTLELAKQIDNFEKKKLEDIKRIFLEFIKIEMIFHAKAIELYTKGYNVIKSINVDDDLKEFRSHFKAHATTLDADSLQECAADEPSKTDPETNASNSTTPKGFHTPQRSVLTTKNVQCGTGDSSFIESKLESGDSGLS